MNKALIVGCLLTASACSTTSGRLELLLNRAAFDMNCPKEQLQTVDLGGEKTYGVTGCGKRATYIGHYCQGNISSSHCQWILNTDEKEIASGAESPAETPAPAVTPVPAVAAPVAPVVPVAPVAPVAPVVPPAASATPR